jgi:hypothetical protein
LDVAGPDTVDSGLIWDDTLVVDILDEMDNVRRRNGRPPPGLSLSESNSSSCDAQTFSKVLCAVFFIQIKVQ